MKRLVSLAFVLAVAAVLTPVPFLRAAPMLAPTPAFAQDAVGFTTPYPDVAVEPGETVSFDLAVTAERPTRVDLSVAEAPEGWTATLRGGGRVIDGVITGPDEPPGVSLDVEIPAGAEPGTHAVSVVAESGGASQTLALELRVAEAVSGGVELAAEFGLLRGPADSTFSFNVDLVNNTGEEQTFNLAASGPEGWQVTAQPSAEERAATATVEAGGTAGIIVDVDPPDSVTAGTYPVTVRAEAGGGQAAQAELEVEITGNYQMTLTTPTERLNAEVTAGSSTRPTVVVVNEGSAPLVGVELSASPPADWEVTFEPATVEQIPPGESAQVTAVITPSGEAVAGDYLVGISASTPETENTIQLRTTVETSSFWGVIGVALIAGTLGSLGWVFHRYGRR